MELTAFELLSALFILVLAAFVGYEVVSKVPTMLHTPLMSGANAVLAFLGVVLGTINVVGGFVVTDRMLEMFKGRGGDRR